MKNLRAFALLLLVLAGCSDSNPSDNGTPDEPVIMPLTVGNTWVGRNTDRSGKVTQDVQEIAAFLEESDLGWYYNARGLGYARHRRRLLLKNPMIQSEPFQLAVMTSNVGDTFANLGWFEQTLENGEPGKRYHIFSIVTSVTEPVTVPAGSFTGIRSEWAAVTESGAPMDPGWGYEGYSIWVPNIGRVLDVDHSYDEKTGERYISNTWELMSYELK